MPWKLWVRNASFRCHPVNAEVPTVAKKSLVTCLLSMFIGSHTWELKLHMSVHKLSKLGLPVKWMSLYWYGSGRPPKGAEDRSGCFQMQPLCIIPLMNGPWAAAYPLVPESSLQWDPKHPNLCSWHPLFLYKRLSSTCLEMCPGWVPLHGQGHCCMVGKCGTWWYQNILWGPWPISRHKSVLLTEPLEMT